MLDIFQYSFIKNALFAVLLITPLLGCLSTVIVNNKMAFFSDALGHSVLTGVAIGTLLNLDYPLISVILFSVAFAIVMILLKNKSKSGMDTTIGVLSSTTIALGLVMLARGGNFNKYSYILIGDLLSIKPTEIYALMGVMAVVIILWFFIYNSLFLGTLSNEFTLRKKISGRVAELIFTIIMAVIVSISIKWVGLLIINSLLVLPAATARIVSRNSKQYMFLSVLIALVCGVLGLFTAVSLNTSVGATIVLYCAACYFLTSIFNS